MCFQTGKLSIQLVKCKNGWGTPWHNVALFDGQDFVLVKRKEAEKKGAKKLESERGYVYFSLHKNEKR